MRYTRRQTLTRLTPGVLALGWAATRPATAAAQVTPTLFLPTTPVQQGSAFLAGLTGSGIGWAEFWFTGRRISPVREGDLWLGIGGVGQDVGSTVQAPPGVYSLVAYYASGPNAPVSSVDGRIRVDRYDYPVEYIQLSPETSALLDPDLIARETEDLRAVYVMATPARRWDGYFVRPSAAALTDVFGSRRSYNGGPATGSHSGVDFGAAQGAPVLAAAGGRVVHARRQPVRGNMIILDHGAGVHTGYCHLSAFNVDEGEEVIAGQRIGAVGSTGLSTGPHLHWEVVVAGMHVDGLRWLAPGEI